VTFAVAATAVLVIAIDIAAATAAVVDVVVSAVATIVVASDTVKISR
jgi:hypothetical protein